jgi:hypothetical protein
MTTPGWQKYGPTWHRQRVICAGCRAATHEPGLWGWARLRDASGFVIARCRRCSPLTKGRPGDSTFGRGVTPRRRVALHAEEED